MADDATADPNQRAQGPRGPRDLQRAWTRPPSSPSTDRVRHPRYNKTVQRTTKLYVHDEANDLNVGDRVRVQETRPLSKLKRWRVVEVLERAR